MSMPDPPIHMYSAMIFSVESERLMLMSSLRRAMVSKGERERDFRREERGRAFYREEKERELGEEWKLGK